MSNKEKERREKAALRLKIVQHVSFYADSEEFYNKAKELGETAANNAKGDDSKRRSQITNLENIANNAMKITDVLNYLKKQIGRDKKVEFWRKEQLGEDLIIAITGELKKNKESICDVLLLGNSPEAQYVHLYLTREFIRQMAAHYEMKVNL